jgi:hypothetical protein
VDHVAGLVNAPVAAFVDSPTDVDCGPVAGCIASRKLIGQAIRIATLENVDRLTVGQRGVGWHLNLDGVSIGDRWERALGQRATSPVTGREQDPDLRCGSSIGVTGQDCDHKCNKEHGEPRSLRPCEQAFVPC